MFTIEEFVEKKVEIINKCNKYDIIRFIYCKVMLKLI